MSLIVQTLIIGIISLISYFVFSPSVAGWIAWVGYLIFAIVLFFKGLQDRKEILQGKTGDLTGATMLAPAMFLVAIMLVVFLFINYSKLHLLWLAPLATFIVEVVIGRLVFGKMEKQILEKHSKH